MLHIVSGSLIYCAAFWPVAQHEAICGMGFDDSKALGEGERERLFDALRAQGSIGWVIEEISATEISEVTVTNLSCLVLSTRGLCICIHGDSCIHVCRRCCGPARCL